MEDNGTWLLTAARLCYGIERTHFRRRVFRLSVTCYNAGKTAMRDASAPTDRENTSQSGYRGWRGTR
jgi:hypothetical protein